MRSLHANPKNYKGGTDRKTSTIELLSHEPDREVTVVSCENPWEQELSFPTILTLPDKYIMIILHSMAKGNAAFAPAMPLRKTESQK